MYAMCVCRSDLNARVLFVTSPEACLLIRPLSRMLSVDEKQTGAHWDSLPSQFKEIKCWNFEDFCMKGNYSHAISCNCCSLLIA